MTTLFKASEAGSGKLLLPPDTYQFVVVDCGLKVSANNPEHEYFNLRFRVDGGKFDGKQIFHMISWKHPKVDFLKSQHGNLANFMFAVGIEEINSLEDFVVSLSGRSFKAKVYHTKDDKEGISDFTKLDGTKRKVEKQSAKAVDKNDQDVPF